MVYISYMSSVCGHTKDRKGEEGRRKRGRGITTRHVLAYKFHVGQRNLRAKLESRVWATPAIPSLPSGYLSE